MHADRKAKDSDDDSASEDESEESEDDEEAKERAEQAKFEKLRNRADKKKEREFNVAPEEITWEMVDKKMREICMARGKKGVDKQEQVCPRSFPPAPAPAPSQVFVSPRMCIEFSVTISSGKR